MSRSNAASKAGQSSASARKEKAQYNRDESRGISIGKRDYAAVDRRHKRAVAAKNTKAGKPAVSTAKGLAVKPKGPLAGVRRAAFKAVAKVQRAVRGKDSRGKKLPRWAA
jgi:hypothetical protein